MAKAKTKYICSNCGANFASWSGKCSNCNEWNTLEQVIDVSSGSKAQQAVESGKPLTATNMLQHTKKVPLKRIPSGTKDIDEVLGGGFVPGGVCLVAGQPGIGKSTLLLQLAYSISKDVSLLYVSGEESPEQVSMRGKRIGTASKLLHLASSNSANDIAATIMSGEYPVVIVDSIQTIATDEIAGVPGSVSQVTNSAQIVTLAAKRSNTTVILVGHVTKEGSIAGPKVLEHLVDVVMQLEGDRSGGFRILRSTKNRFGSTNEAAILEMTESGLSIVSNPSAALLAERQVSDGSVVTATLEGTRPVLVEVQALVNATSYGYPKRTASGFDLSRLNLLIAMLEKRTKLTLSDKDIYINIVGGLKIIEPAADLAICMAIASAAKNLPLSIDAVCFGEVGLSGEVRHVPWIEKRINEAKKMGFERIIGPKLPKKVNTPPQYETAISVRDTLIQSLTKG